MTADGLNDRHLVVSSSASWTFAFRGLVRAFHAGQRDIRSRRSRGTVWPSSNSRVASAGRGGSARGARVSPPAPNNSPRTADCHDRRRTGWPEGQLRSACAERIEQPHGAIEDGVTARAPRASALPLGSTTRPLRLEAAACVFAALVIWPTDSLDHVTHARGAYGDGGEPPP